MRLQAKHIVADRYEIEESIGTGGMSVVYRAHDKKLDRKVTFKVLKDDYLTDEDLVGRFPEEARAAAALNHQNIVSIFDHGRDGDICYIVLEYIDGASLKELINRKAPFDNETTIAVAIQVCEGLAAAHRTQIIHRDIKPQNILVTSATGVAKVADFGIARAAKNTTLTAGSGSMGSVHYFSPEQARGGYLDHKTDIYSMGVVIYEMATGKLPFDGDNEISVALQHINDEFPDMLKINPNVSDSIVRIVQKATAKSASSRYKNVEEMIDDLKRATTDVTGSFVRKEDKDTSPTRKIPKETRDAIQRQKARDTFLGANDNGQAPENDTDNPDDPVFEQEEFEFEEDTQYVQDTKKSDRMAILLGIALAIPFLILVTFGARAVYRRFATETVIAPAIEGMSMYDAEAAAARYGLNLYVFREEYSAELAEGYIIEQHQVAGRVMSPGDPLQVTVSLGEMPHYIMPAVTMRTLADAMAQLELLGVVVEIEYYQDESIPRNTIVGQEPSANTSMEPGTVVILRVSSGPEQEEVSVPHLIGQTEVEALELLREANLIAGVVTRQESTTYPQGTIIMQDPMPHDVVERNTVVSYTVSTGPPAPTPPPQPTPTPPPADADTTPAEPPGETPPDDAPVPPQPPEEPDTPQEISAVMQIVLWPVAEGTQYVHLLIQRQDGNNEPDLAVNDPNVPVDSFPRNFHFSGYGDIMFHIFSIENDVPVPRGSQSFNLVP